LVFLVKPDGPGLSGIDKGAADGPTSGRLEGLCGRRAGWRADGSCGARGRTPPTGNVRERKNKRISKLHYEYSTGETRIQEHHVGISETVRQWSSQIRSGRYSGSCAGSVDSPAAARGNATVNRLRSSLYG
jgi:hypothetical protein